MCIRDRFIIIEAQQKGVIQQKTILSKYYRKRKLAKQFEQVYNTAWQQQEQQAFRSADFYLERYQLQLEDYQFSSFAERTSPQNLQAVSDSLDTALIILKLKTACLAVSHQVVFQQDYEFGLLPQILEYVKTHKLTELPAIGVYYHTYYALKGASIKEHFQYFKDILFQYLSLIHI